MRACFLMNFPNQSRSCHPERSEGSRCPASQTLRYAQGDKTLPMVGGNIHEGQRTGHLHYPFRSSKFIRTGAIGSSHSRFWSVTFIRTKLDIFNHTLHFRFVPRWYVVTDTDKPILSYCLLGVTVVL